MHVRLFMAAFCKFSVVETDEEEAEAARGKVKAINTGKKRVQVSAIKDKSDESECSECEEDEIEEPAGEGNEFFDPAVPTLDSQNVDHLYFDADLWKLNELPVQPSLDFIGASGPLHQLSPAASPFQFFCLFIPMFMWDRWAIYTNKKASKMESHGKKRRYWSATCAAELKAWVATVMWWALAKNMSMETLYAESFDLNKIKVWIPSWTRWEQLKRFFKVSDPDEDLVNKSDKLQRIRELWEDFVSRCRANYWPGREIGLDEAIKRFKGRCSFKQYIKNKPIRWGLKLFCVCCSLTGYLWNAAWYLGKLDETDAKQAETSATHRSVLQILTPLSNKNHIVHMDNFYTSVPLLNQLLQMGILGCGTIRMNRKGLCPDVCMKKTEESQLKKKPGTIRFASYGPLCFMSWFAKRPVHMLTNCYPPTSGGENGKVMHWFTEGGVKVQREIDRPPAIKYYNLNMGAVDLFDQLRSYVALDLQSRKYWHPMFWFVMESALINSWVLYKATRETAGLPLEYTSWTFRKSVALALALEWEGLGCMKQDPALSTPTKLYKSTKVVRSHQKTTHTSAIPVDRYLSEDKHAQHFERIPNLESSKLKKRQMLCTHCKVSRSIFWCKKCLAPLCKGTCYIRYHTKPGV